MFFSQQKYVHFAFLIKQVNTIHINEEFLLIAQLLRWFLTQGRRKPGGSGGKLVHPDFVTSKITVLQICMQRGFCKFTKFWLNISGPNYVSNSTHIQQGLGFPNTLTQLKLRQQQMKKIGKTVTVYLSELWIVLDQTFRDLSPMKNQVK